MSEVLRLADALDALMDEESLVGAVTIDRAAAELRRLHQSEREGWRWADELEQERKRLHALNAELVEALRLISATFDDSWMEDSVERVMGDKARAALAKVEASK